MFEIARSWVDETKGKRTITEIRFTNFDDKTVDLFEKECNRISATVKS
jgi:hypothetical protein